MACQDQETEGQCGLMMLRRVRRFVQVVGGRLWGRRGEGPGGGRVTLEKRKVGRLWV